MRPVVFFISAPTYHLAKRVDYWIKNTIDHLSTYAVKSSAQLVQKIKNVTPPANATLLSLDVVSKLAADFHNQFPFQQVERGARPRFNR